VLAVTNRDPVNAIPAALEIVGATRPVSARVFEINGPDVHANNSFEQPDAVNVRERALEDGAAQWVFAAHSISLLRLQL
jgi:alpha-L-arabinofuranosidase